MGQQDYFDYAGAVAFIEDVPRFTKKNKPENTVELLRRLGHPEEHFDIVHVAGTNGKGSVCAFLESIERAAGKKTGLFTSPHLVHINERFQINRENVDDRSFLDAFLRVKAVIDEMTADGFCHPTYFEILFAVGMVIFDRSGIDILIMETGLGGRLDATNTVAHPGACVITSISLDHTEYLGDTVELIAAEKAGIIKEGVPVIFDARDPRSAQVIRKKADEMHAPAIPFYEAMAQVVSRNDNGIDFVLNNRYYDYKAVHVPFLADYQVANSSLAMMAARVIDPDRRISDRTIVRAVADTRWAGRMECVLPGVVLDGAHNEDGIRQFLKTVRETEKRHSVSLLFAAVAEKNYHEMIHELATQAHFSSIVVTQVGGVRKVDAEEFAAIFRKETGVTVTAVKDVREAFETALSRRPEGGVLFCAGSLYMVGEIEAYLRGETVQPH